MRPFLLFFLIAFYAPLSSAAFVDSNGKRFETMDSALSFYLNQCTGPVRRGLYYGYTSGKISGHSLVLSPYKYSDSSCEKPYSIVGGSTVIKLTEICEPPKIANEVTGICEEPDFCQSSQFLGLVATESNACAAQYPDHYTNFSHTCKSSSNYSFTCKQGAPKPPTGGGSGSGGDGSGSGGDGSGSGGDGSGSGGDGSGSGGDGSGSGGDGSGSGGDGSGSGGDGSGSGGDGSGSGGDGSGSGGDGSGSGGDGSGSGGSGSGSGGSGSGSVDLSGVINRINQSNKLLGDLKKNSVNQLQKDVEHHLANKALLSQQLQAIGDGSTGITNAIGDSANGITNAIGGQTTALTDAIGQLSDKLPEQCIPTPENRFCENPHGLDSDYVGQVFGQMDTRVSDTISEGHDLIESTVQKVIDEPLTNEVQGIMTDSQQVLLNALGYNQACTPLVFNANGSQFSIDCKVSQQIKLILSFLIGMYTLMTLIDILLDGITPLGRKPSATRYA